MCSLEIKSSAPTNGSTFFSLRISLRSTSTQAIIQLVFDFFLIAAIYYKQHFAIGLTLSTPHFILSWPIYLNSFTMVLELYVTRYVVNTAIKYFRLPRTHTLSIFGSVFFLFLISTAFNCLLIHWKRRVQQKIESCAIFTCEISRMSHLFGRSRKSKTNDLIVSSPWQWRSGFVYLTLNYF